MAQTRRALSRSPRFDPNKLASDITDHITVACGLLGPAVRRREHGQNAGKEGGKNKEWAELGKPAVSCLPE